VRCADRFTEGSASDRWYNHVRQLLGERGQTKSPPRGLPMQWLHRGWALYDVKCSNGSWTYSLWQSRYNTIASMVGVLVRLTRQGRQFNNLRRWKTLKHKPRQMPSDQPGKVSRRC
jgi:hypothetical protein